MNEAVKARLSKVPEVTLGFWMVKILATTLGTAKGMGFIAPSLSSMPLS